MAVPATIEEYLEQVGRGVESAFGRRYRQQFRDQRGTAELAMLAAPTAEEYEDLKRTVAVMAQREKDRAYALTDDEVQDIAARADADAGTVGIFFNGYALACRTESAGQENSDKENNR